MKLPCGFRACGGCVVVRPGNRVLEGRLRQTLRFGFPLPATPVAVLIRSIVCARTTPPLDGAR